MYKVSFCSNSNNLRLITYLPDYAFSFRSTVRVAGVVGAAAVGPVEEVHRVGPTA